MKWFQVDADTPHDPKIQAVLRALGAEGLGGLFLVWCHIADHGTRRPGWSLDSAGHPMPEAELRAISTLSEANFYELITICVSSGHFLKTPWEKRKVIAIPAMAKRADTYTHRKLRSSFEHASNNGRRNYLHKTVQTKTVQAKEKEKAPTAPLSDPSAVRTPEPRRRDAPGGRVERAASAPVVDHALLKKYGLD